jgi:hypothetical protein
MNQPQQTYQDALAAERRAREQSDYDSMVNAIAAAQSDAEAAQLQAQQCSAMGDHAGLADAYRRMARAESRLTTLESGKEAFDDNEASRVRQAEIQQQQRQYSPDEMINYWLANRAIDNREADLLRRHPEYLTDPKKWQELQAVNREAYQKGLQRGTGQHVGFMYERLGVLPRLNPEQQRAAKDSGVSEEVYAQNEIKRLKVEHLYQRSNQ